MTDISFGPQTCGSGPAAAQREWLVADGLGGFAMGTVAGLSTRRYHGLLVVATEPPIGRRLGLAALDPVVVVGDRRVRLATHEWAGGAVDPAGHVHLSRFTLADGVPTWRFAIGDVVLERSLAMARGRPALGVVHRLVRSPRPVRLELDALCTWRDLHGERLAGGDPSVETVGGGFVFEGAYRVRGPGFTPGGAWYRGVAYRLEAERGLNPVEDLYSVGRFVAELAPGEEVGVEAWAGDLSEPAPPAAAIVAAARRHARDVAVAAHPVDQVDSALAVAADQFVVAGPTVVAGYPWFGDWSRDTMTSYQGLFLETGRADEGRTLLTRAAASLSEGMLANTADVGGTEYNTVDAALWFLHAVERHVAVTGDLDLAAELVPDLAGVVEHHLAGTRYGIRVDTDGLVTQGEPGVALTWMDARVDGTPVTARAGKPVEINALWVNGLMGLAGLAERTKTDVPGVGALAEQARSAFVARFVRPYGGGLFDVVDVPGGGDDPTLRPNQLLAVSLPHGPLAGAAPEAGRAVVAACAPLLTPLGLRSLSSDDPRYRSRHRGGPAERDRAYHQGTVWPWLIGAYAEAALRAGMDTAGLLDGLVAHLGEWGLGSASETADGEAPHAATGCPFQAWSVAELLRVRRLLGRAGGDDG